MRFHRFHLELASVAFLLIACESNTTPTSPRPIAAQRALNDVGDDYVQVVGVGDPAIDVPAVQAAVDRGGAIVLRGHFSFEAPPTKLVSPVLSSGGAYPPLAEVLVSKAVTISGAAEDDEMPTIEGGTIPFYVEAPNAPVTIRGLRFVRPISNAVLVYAVHGLEIAANRVEGLDPFAANGHGHAIGIITTGGIPNPTIPANPENIAGKLSIVHNYIDVMGAAGTSTLGIVVYSAGVAGAEADFDVSGNTVKNTTEAAINFRRIVGRARIEHNAITTGSLVVTPPVRPAVIRAANSGTYVIAHNSIDCGWAASDAEGIGVFSQFSAWPVDHVVVADNDVTMSAPAGTGFTAFSAGIGVFGFANDNVVRDNRIRGAARAGVSIPSVFPLPPLAPATPQGNTFIDNRFVDFTPTDADIFVGTHAFATRIVGPGTVDDQGTGTVVGPTAAARWNAIAGAQTLTHAISQQLGSRIFAYLSLAQYNAAIAAEDAKGGEHRASVPAAVAAASVAVLSSFYPDQTASFGALLAEQEAQSQPPNEPHSDFGAGTAIGRAAGAAIIARAATDGFTSSADTFRSEPGASRGLHRPR